MWLACSVFVSLSDRGERNACCCAKKPRTDTRTHTHSHALTRTLSLPLAFDEELGEPENARACESGESTLMVCVEASNSFFQHFLSRKNTLTLALLDHPSPPTRARPRHTRAASMRVRLSLSESSLYQSKNIDPNQC